MKQNAEARESLAIEISDVSTKVVRIQAVGEACLIDEVFVMESILRREKKTTLVDEAMLSLLLAKAGQRTAVSLVLHDSQSFNFMFRVPVATEDQIREFVRLNLRRNHQIELSDFRWSIIAAADQTSFHEGITTPISKAKNVLISGTSRRLAEVVTESFQRRGISVENIFFPVACQLRAFHLYGGSLLGNETISLVHLQAARCSVALFQGNAFIAYKDIAFDENAPGALPCLVKQVRAYLHEVEEKIGLAVKCTFVSSATAHQENFVTALKSAGRYARTWSALKKLPVAAGRRFAEPLETVGTQLNTTVGAALIACERESFHVSEKEFHIAETIARPLCVLACALTLMLGHLAFRTVEVRKTVSSLRQELKSKGNTKDPVDELTAVTLKIEELDAFSDARRTWSPIVSEIVRLKVKGVNVLQVYGAGGTSPLERQPFMQKSPGGPKRKNSSRFVVEADNVAGLKSLEEFIESIQANAAISSLLDQRTPVRLLGNYQTSEDSGVTRVSVEYRLNEKLF